MTPFNSKTKFTKDNDYSPVQLVYGDHIMLLVINSIVGTDTHTDTHTHTHTDA